MRELILKIRHWLIKKLGGYTEQHVNNHTVTMKTHRFQPVKLIGGVYIDDYSPFSSFQYSDVSDQETRDRVRWIKREMVYQIADKLIENDLVLIKCCDDPIKRQRQYVAELNVIHPHDAAMCMF